MGIPRAPAGTPSAASRSGSTPRRLLARPSAPLAIKCVTMPA
jgi:hypothetical protein